MLIMRCRDAYNDEIGYVTKPLKYVATIPSVDRWVEEISMRWLTYAASELRVGCGIPDDEDLLQTEAEKDQQTRQTETISPSTEQQALDPLFSITNELARLDDNFAVAGEEANDSRGVLNPKVNEFGEPQLTESNEKRFSLQGIAAFDSLEEEESQGATTDPSFDPSSFIESDQLAVPSTTAVPEDDNSLALFVRHKRRI